MADLAQALLATELRALHEARRTGVLLATRGDTSKGIFLREGAIVFASSTLDSEKLGESLIRLGRISRDDFAAAVRANAGKGRRLGQALVEAGVIGDEELGKLVAHQVRKIVLSLFTWTEGEAEFHEAPDAIPEDLAMDLSTGRLLFEGTRIFPDGDRLERALPEPERRLRMVASPPFDPAAAALSPAERQVLAAAGEGRTVDQALQAAPRRDLAVRALHALLAGGLVGLEAAVAAARRPMRPPPPRELFASFIDPGQRDAREDAARLTREAHRLLLARKDRDEAVSKLQEAVKLDPASHPARRLLAVALADHPSLHRNAERHFRAALEMEPGDVELRYRLALHYKRAGLPRRAASELQAVLAQEPGHKGADTLLRAIERAERGGPR